MRSEEFTDGLEHDFEEQRNLVIDLRKTLEEKKERIRAQQTEVRHLEQSQQRIEEELSATKVYPTKLEEDIWKTT